MGTPTIPLPRNEDPLWLWDTTKLDRRNAVSHGLSDYDLTYQGDMPTEGDVEPPLPSGTVTETVWPNPSRMGPVEFDDESEDAMSVSSVEDVTDEPATAWMITFCCQEHQREATALKNNNNENEK